MDESNINALKAVMDRNEERRRLMEAHAILQLVANKQSRKLEHFAELKDDIADYLRQARASQNDIAHPFDKLPDQHLEHVNRWLASNEKTADQVRWSLYPIGMVGRWIERAETAEARASQEPRPESGELRERARTKAIQISKMIEKEDESPSTSYREDYLTNELAAFAASERGQWVSVEQAIVNFPLGHNHWDHTMQHGAGCELCQSQYEAKQALLALVRSFAPPADKKE